jgi:hypothetical protein
MKKLLSLILLCSLLACNDAADTKPHDVDHTENEDTSAKERVKPDSLRTDTLSVN